MTRRIVNFYIYGLTNPKQFIFTQELPPNIQRMSGDFIWNPSLTQNTIYFFDSSCWEVGEIHIHFSSLSLIGRQLLKCPAAQSSVIVFQEKTISGV